MKKLWLIILTIGCIHSNVHAQIEDTDLQELVIERMSDKNVAEIIYEIRKNLYNNYAENDYRYLVENFSTIQIDDCTDSLIDIRMLYNVNLDLKRKKINKYVIKSDQNRENLNPNYFSLYPGANDSPLYWLTEFVLRKYVNVVELDFFINVRDYHYSRSMEKGNIRVDFSAAGLYYGHFVYDKNYNLLEVEFRLDEPYPIDHSQSKNGKFMFQKNWVYQSELLQIKFKLNAKNKLYIQSLEASEKIVDYNFLRYNSKGEVMVDDRNLDFDTRLKFTKQ